MIQFELEVCGLATHKMPRDVRMAAMRKLHCCNSRHDEWPVWAGHVAQHESQPLIARALR